MEHYYVSACVIAFLGSYYFRRPFEGLGCYVAYFVAILYWHIAITPDIGILFIAALVFSLLGWLFAALTTNVLYFAHCKLSFRSNLWTVVYQVAVWIWSLVYDFSGPSLYAVPVYFVVLIFMHVVFWIGTRHEKYLKLNCKTVTLWCSEVRNKNDKKNCVQGCKMNFAKVAILVVLIFLGIVFYFLTPTIRITFLTPVRVLVIALVVILLALFVVLIVRVYSNGKSNNHSHHKKKRKKDYHDDDHDNDSDCDDVC